MKKITYYKCETTDLLKAAIDLFLKIRNEKHKSLSEDEIMGINYSIILNTACIIEGKLEIILSSIVYFYEKVYMSVKFDKKYDSSLINGFYNNTIADLKNRVSKTTGINNYIGLIELLISDYKISPEMKELNESINVLFEFRNVLAHGRMIKAETETNMPYPDYVEKEIMEYFKGGYKKTEDYLFKNKLIDSKFLDIEKNDFYFSNIVADHFLKQSQKYLVVLMKSLPNDIRNFVNKDCKI